MKAWLESEASPFAAYQFRQVASGARNDAILRVPPILLIVTGLFAAGHQVTAIAYFWALFVVELIPLRLFKTKSRKNGLVTNGRVALFAITHFTAATFYSSVAFLALSAQSIPLAVSGFIWLIGSLHYVSINYAKQRLYYFLSIVPFAISALIYAILISNKPLTAGGALDSYAPVFLTTLLLMVSFHLTQKQRDIERALAQTQKESAERLARLEFAASRDELTGLLNRSAFNKKLLLTISKVSTAKGKFGYLLIDLDGFKPINDSFGHQTGDQVLQEVSARLINTVGRNGYVARVGGDEFAVVLPKSNTIDQLEDIALDLIRVIGLPIKSNETEVSVGLSVGAYLCDDTQTTPEKINACADEALYQAKEVRQSSIVHYTPSTPKRRYSIEEKSNIELAIRNQLIKPYYQPKFRLSDKKVVGFEALARWPLRPTDPNDNAHFVAKIEELGLLGEFTYRMARQVFADIKLLVEEGYDPGQVSLNLPEATLATENGFEDIDWLLAEHSAIVDHITLEITEDVFIARSGARIRENVHALRNTGAKISLDDFGTGFASFQHLRQLEFDEMKIDTAFVAGLGQDPTAEVIVTGFLSIAEGLGVSVVAEGVETEAQRQYLLERGCPVAQGFLFAKAQPIEEIRQYLEIGSGRQSA